MIKRKTIAYELGFENEAYFSRFLKSQQVSVRENSQKKCASKSMICAFFRQWNTFTLASL
jgi:AraC-like DNA-binding protein